MTIVCIGSNYRHHVKEMGGAQPREPIWFLKPDGAIVVNGPIEIPANIGEVHHEVELALRIGKTAHRVDAELARACIDAFTVAIDVTARSLQSQAKADGKPWARAKGFDSFLPLGQWMDATDVDLSNLRLKLSVDGDVRQDGNTADATWSPVEVVALASQWTTLQPGDIVMTGTPEGVGPIEPGNLVVASIEDHVTMEVPVLARS